MPKVGFLCAASIILLVFEVSEGWLPLCSFLDVAEPDTLISRANDRVEFWDRVKGKL